MRAKLPGCHYGTRVHLLGVAEHGGRLLDHLEVGVKHNETSHFTKLLLPPDRLRPSASTGSVDDS